jgi:predicted MFS family arabinose efflux permease
VLGKMPLALAGGGGWVLLNLASNDVGAQIASSAALALGLMHATRGVGTGVGPVVSERLLRRGMSIKVAGRIAAAAALGGIALFALTSSWQVMLVSIFAWGAGIGSNWVVTCAEIQRLSPDRFVGRLSAIDGLAHTFGMCAAALAGAAIVDATGVQTASAWLGLAAAITALAAVRWALSTKAAAPIEPPAALSVKTGDVP